MAGSTPRKAVQNFLRPLLGIVRALPPRPEIEQHRAHHAVHRGWKTLGMVQRYAHLAPCHLKAAVERLVPANAMELARN